MSTDAQTDQTASDLATAIREKLTAEEIKRLAEILSDAPSSGALRDLLAPLPAGGYGTSPY